MLKIILYLRLISNFLYELNFKNDDSKNQYSKFNRF